MAELDGVVEWLGVFLAKALSRFGDGDDFDCIV
jgi:hypothetical protein